MNYRFTIIVPIYNEADNIERLEKELIAFTTSSQTSTKILFINDGSTDSSQILIETVCDKYSNCDYILLSKNQGLSTALKAGFDSVTTELVGYIDADLQTTPHDFHLLLEHINHYDLVTGVRQNRKDSFVKKVSSTVANYARRLFTQDGMDDTGCPLKVLKTKNAKCIPMFKGLHRFLPAMILLQDGSVKQIPVQHFARIAGTSKYGLTKRLFSPLIDCFAYLWMKKKTINYKIKKQSSDDVI
nr:glycosyltransferase [uncultured Psychroserpens sp.]